MSSASDYLENAIVDHLLRTGSWTKPTNVYVALFTTLPAEDGTGGTEVSGGNYARVLHGPGDAYWSAPSSGDGISSNVGSITFPAPNALWGTVVGFALYDASSGGTMLLAKTLTTPRTIASGDPAPNFPEGALQITVA